MVLLALLRLNDDAYGVTVRREIQNRTDRRVAIGAVYACLERLERKGYVTARVSDPQPIPGGRARKYFRLTREGAAALRRAREMMDRMTEGLSVAWSCPRGTGSSSSKIWTKSSRTWCAGGVASGRPGVGTGDR
jgi:DNA-binding PadR family transcriptional regulator